MVLKPIAVRDKLKIGLVIGNMAFATIEDAPSEGLIVGVYNG